MKRLNRSIPAIILKPPTIPMEHEDPSHEDPSHEEFPSDRVLREAFYRVAILYPHLFTSEKIVKALRRQGESGYGLRYNEVVHEAYMGEWSEEGVRFDLQKDGTLFIYVEGF
jgi:hypothetical protein